MAESTKDTRKDTRIVEMQFDSRDFDKNIKKSQKSLEDFKKELNFEDAVRQMNDGVTEQSGLIQKMASNIQKLTNEMTGIGSLSTFVAQKIKSAWQGAINSVEGFAKSLTSAQMNVGWDKYDKVTRYVQTIMNATGDTEAAVYTVMERLNHYTDETSYSFSEMAGSISKFTTAGVGLADAETEMEGIANWAALAGQGVNEANRAMYNISQAMSAGHMKLIDYKSIQNANMDIRAFREEAIKAAVAVGTLTEKNGKFYSTAKKNKEVNIDNFTETLQLGWFDKKTMEQVFKVFADNTNGIGEQAYKAAQRCMTFSDALNAIKDMLSTGWMKTYEHIFGKLSDAMALFSGLCNKAEEALAKFMDTRNGILEYWADTGRDSLWGALVGEIESPDGDILFKGAYGLLDALSDVGDMIYDAFFDFAMMFANGNNYDLYKNDKEGFFAFMGESLTRLTKRVQEFSNRIKTFFTEIPAGQSMSRFDQIKQVVMALYATVLLVTMGIKGIAQFIGEVLGQLQPTFDAILGFFSFVASLFTGNVVNMAKKNTIGNFFHNLAETLRPLTTIINVVVTSLAQVTTKVLGFLQATGMLQPAMIALVVGKILSLVTKLQAKKGILGFIGNIFGGRFGKIGMVVTALGGILGLVQRLTGVDITGGAIGWLQNLIGNPGEMAAKLKEFAKKAKDTIWSSKIYTAISEWFSETFQGKSAGDIWEGIKAWFASLGTKVPALLAELKGNLGKIIGKIGTVLDSFFGEIIGLFVGSAKADEAADAVNEAVVAILTPGADSGTGDSERAGQSLVERLKASCDRLLGPIKNFFGNFFGNVGKIFESDAVKKIGKFFGGTTFMGLLTNIASIVKFSAMFRGAGGLISVGKGMKGLGKGIKVFGKNLKDLNFSGLFSNMFNFSNAFSGNNSNNITKNGSTWKDFGKNILMIAGAVGILTLAALKLGEMKPDALKQAGIALGAMVGGLIAAGVAAKKWTGNGSALLKMAGAIALMLYPLKKLMKLPWGEWNGDGLLSGLIKLGSVIGVIALAARLAGNVQMKGLMGMAVAVNLLLHPIRQLAKMQLYGTKIDGKTWDPNGGGLGQAIVALGLIMAAMSGAARLGNSNKIKGVLSFAISLNLLIRPIQKLAEMNLQQYLQGVLGISTIIFAIGALAYTVKDSKLASLAGVVTAVTALAFIGVIIGHMDWRHVALGFGPIILMIGAIAAVCKYAGKLDEKQINGLKNIFITLAVVIGLMAAGIAAIGYFDIGWEPILAFLGGLTAVIGVTGVIMALLSKTDVGSMVTAALGLFLGVVAVCGALAIMAPVLLGSIGNSLAELSSRLKLTSGLLSDFFGEMEGISEESANHTKKVFDKLKELVESFAGFGDYTSDISGFATQMMLLQTGLGFIFLNEYSESEDSPVFKILDKFVEIGPSLANFSVGSMPMELVRLGGGLRNFSTSTAGITSADTPALGLLQGIFGQADNIDKFCKLPLTMFATQMSTLGGAMSLYAQGASEVTGLDNEGEIDKGAIGRAVAILEAVMNAITDEGALSDLTLPEMPEEGDLALFGAKLAALAGALGQFITAAEGMSENTQKALDALDFLSDLQGKLTTDKLALFSVFGDAGLDKDMLGEFALDIEALGSALSNFSSLTENTVFDNGLGALDKFADLNEKVTATNLGFVSAFTDAQVDKSALEQFGTDIGALGTALASFAKNVRMDDGTTADFDHAVQALNFMVTLQRRLPQLGGLQELIHGHTTTFTELGGDLESLGQGLGDFYLKLTNLGDKGETFDYNQVSGAIDMLSGLTNILTTLAGFQNEGDVFAIGDFLSTLDNMLYVLTESDTMFGTSNLMDPSTTVPEKIAKFAKELSDAFTQAGNIDTSAIHSFMEIASGLNSLSALDMTNLGGLIIDGMKSGMEENEEGLMGTVVTLMGQISTTMAENTDMMPTITPVLNLDQVREDASSIGGLIDQYYGLSLQNVLETAAGALRSEGPTDVNVLNPTDLSGVQNNMAMLHADIRSLNTAISNIKIVLNTGVVAGGVTNSVDANLLRNALFASRRNADNIP